MHWHVAGLHEEVCFAFVAGSSLDVVLHECKTEAIDMVDCRMYGHFGFKNNATVRF